MQKPRCFEIGLIWPSSRATKPWGVRGVNLTPDPIFSAESTNKISSGGLLDTPTQRFRYAKAFTQLMLTNRSGLSFQLFRLPRASHIDTPRTYLL